jgi:chemotaxis protein methyltransferase CheR
MVAVTPEEFDAFAKYIYRVSGISLEKNKKYLLETRLNPLLVSFNCHNFSELYNKANQDSSGELQKKIIDAISTNETYFFRDSSPFEVFKHKIVPELLDKRLQAKQDSLNIRIWSAACSTGQEVYTIAISLFEVLPKHKGIKFHVTGTDISDEAIAKASYGKYNQFEIERGLSKPLLNKYFTQSAGGYRINDEIRAMVSFKKLNLMEPFYGIGPFDIVFCRNVAIYFTLEDKKRLFQKISRVLTKDGYLVVGGSESLTGVAPQFSAHRYLGATYYQLKQGQGIAPQKEQVQERPTPKTTEKQVNEPQARAVAKQASPGLNIKRAQKQPNTAKKQTESTNPEPAKKSNTKKEAPLKQGQEKVQKTLNSSFEKQAQGKRLLDKLVGQQAGKKGFSEATSAKKSSGNSLLSSLNKKSQDKKDKK